MPVRKLFSCFPPHIVVGGSPSSSTLTVRAFKVVVRDEQDAPLLMGRVKGEINREAGTIDIFEITLFVAPRCGLGTKLYEALAVEAGKRGLQLRSDDVLSESARGFWEKQVSKGRAEWDEKKQRFLLKSGETDLGSS